MSTEPSGPIKVFLAYAHQDERLLRKLTKHLSSLKQKISIWDDRNILPGEDRTRKIYAHLNTSDLILLLISPDFIDSDECHEIMLRAMKRQREGRAHIVPIILRPTDYLDQPFSELEMLPNNMPITTWPNTDKALFHVVSGIKKVADELQNSKIMFTHFLPSLPSEKLPTAGQLGTTPVTVEWKPIKDNRYGCGIDFSFKFVIFFILILGASGIALLAYINSQQAIVIISPASKLQNASYSISAVTSTPDAKQYQIQARQLSYTTPPQSKTVNSTGIVQKLGLQAKGTLTFYNGKTVQQTVAAETVFTDSQGIQIINDVPVIIPAAIPPTEGQATVQVHAVNTGLNGNISVLDFNTNCCTPDNTIFVKNLSPFTGGRDTISYRFVQQSDIDSAATFLEQSLTPNAQTSLQSQIHANEALVSPILCNSMPTSDHNANDRADSVKVTVVVTCTGEVYDKQAAESMTVALFKQETTQNLGPGYQLTGNVKTTIVQVKTVNPTGSLLALQVRATGLWVYQFSAAQLEKLVRLIAGKTSQNAIKVLKQQIGVSDVRLSEVSETLPTDPTKIVIKIES